MVRGLDREDVLLSALTQVRCFWPVQRVLSLDLLTPTLHAGAVATAARLQRP